MPRRKIIGQISQMFEKLNEQMLASRAFQFAIRIDSIRYANRFELIRFVKKSAFRFTSCHAAFALNK